MYGTVAPVSVVVTARSAGGLAGSYGLKHEGSGGVAGGVAGGFGSGSVFAHFAGPSVLWYQSLTSVAMLHWASIAAVDRPLALDAGMPFISGTAVGVAHVNGVTCAPENTGPPILWLMIFSVTGPLPTSAVTVFSPSTRPVSTPVTRLPCSANASVTLVLPSLTASRSIGVPAGNTISTNASPPLIRSGRLDSVFIC